MTFEVHREIMADHPSLPGHFPGAPLVPGVLILDEVFAALQDWNKDCRVTAIPTVKFLRPLKPKQPFTVRFSTKKDNTDRINFSCSIEGSVIAEGQLETRSRTRVTS